MGEDPGRLLPEEGDKPVDGGGEADTGWRQCLQVMHEWAAACN